MSHRNARILLAALAIPAVLVTLAASFARAAPLDPRELPADTKWFLHIDLDAARSSQVATALRDAWLAQPDTRDGLKKLYAETGIDAPNDLHGITVFDTSYESNAGNAGVVLVHGKVDRNRLTRWAESRPDHAAASHGRDSIHTWTDPDSHRKAAGAIHGDDVVVLSESKSAVAAELDVLDGKRETFASKKPADAKPADAKPADAKPAAAPGVPAWSWSPGVTVSAAALGLASDKDLRIDSPILRECDELAIEVGEHDGRAFVHATLRTKSPEVAQQVRSLVDGLKALVQLQSAKDPGVAKALAPLKVVADGPAVRVQWDAPVAEAVKAIREQAAKSGHPIPDETPDRGK